MERHRSCCGDRRGRARLRLHQRIPRLRQRDRHLGVDQGADAAGRAGPGRGDERRRRAHLDQGRRDRRRRDHRPADRAPTGWSWCSRRCSARSSGTCCTWYFGLPVVVLARADRRPGRRRARGLARPSSGTACGQGRHPDGALAAGRLRAGLPVHARAAVVLPAGASPTGRTGGSGGRRSASAAPMAFGHGTQDAQKTMGVIALALVVVGTPGRDDIPLWVILASAAAISPAPTPAAGGSCARSAGGSSTSPRPAASPRRRWPAR